MVIFSSNYLEQTGYLKVLIGHIWGRVARKNKGRGWLPSDILSTPPLVFSESLKLLPSAIPEITADTPFC